MKKKKFLFLTLHMTHLAIFFCVLLGCSGLIFLISLTASQQVNTEKMGKLAIVIDDFGLQRKGVREMLGLDCKLTAAIMPFLEHTEDDAEDALENGKEVIIHIPMQATTHDIPSHLGPRPITLKSSEEDIAKWIEDAREDIPEAVGANIHMGTLSSTRREIMRPVFENLLKHNMFFLDSKTSSKSVCRNLAKDAGIRFYENEVFLEHEKKTKGYVKKQLRKAMKIARETGECVAIGHVGYEGGLITAEAILELLPEFKENFVELVFLSELTPETP